MFSSLCFYLSVCSINISLLGFGNSQCRSTNSAWIVVNVCSEPQWHTSIIEKKEGKKEKKKGVKNAAKLYLIYHFFFHLGRKKSEARGKNYSHYEMVVGLNNKKSISTEYHLRDGRRQLC